jgi:preprotein translocase subunit SecD
VSNLSWSLFRRCSSLGVLLVLTLAACSGDEGEGSATSTTSAPSSTTSTASQSSGLQLRAVRATRADACGTLPENPAADQPVTLGGRDGACYDLGPAVMTVRRAQAEIEAQPGGVAVNLTLSPGDTPVFQRLLAENLNKQVAMVVFGRVQTAPTVRDADTNGMIAIAGLDSETAANLVKSLSG